MGKYNSNKVERYCMCLPSVRCEVVVNGENISLRRGGLHNAIEMSDVSANVTDGVLEITLPKVKVEEKEDVVMNVEVTSASGEDDDVVVVNHEEKHLDDNDDEKGVK